MALMRPSDRATAIQRARVGARSSRRARRRTLLSSAAASPSFLADDSLLDESALEEFVIDDDDYPAVVGAPRAMTVPSEPDRVDDIDEWLEEFAVSDCFDDLPH